MRPKATRFGAFLPTRRRAGRQPARSGERGFTLIEIFVVLAVLGLLISLAIARYLGARKNVFIAEADHALQEMRTVAWAYYVQHGTWDGLTDGNVLTVFVFTAPPDADGCWDMGLAANATANEIQLQARGDDTPTKCGPVNGASVTLTLQGSGAASRTQSLP